MIIRNRKTLSSLSIFLSINFLLGTLIPGYVQASNNGPNAPEAAAFEPVDATDMVNLSSGDMSYVLPLLSVGEFPVSLSYHAGIPLDMEASWVGLGWSLNPGAINRQQTGAPDDWKGGVGLDFIRYSSTSIVYNIDVSVGLGKAADVGVGLAWGSNKSLSGSVSATVAGVSASIDTDGNYSVGISTNALKFIGGGGGNPFSESSFGGDIEKAFGGSLSISGNVNGGKVSFNASVGAQTDSGMTAGMGVSFSGSGITGGGLSIGAAGSNTGGSSSLSLGSFSAGDYDVASSGFYIPLKIKLLNLGFGIRKTTIKLQKGYPKREYGILYQGDAAALSNVSVDGQFSDYQDRYVRGDVYRQELPQEEEDFITDYRKALEKANFNFAAYDSYEVTGPGVSGQMQPKAFETLMLHDYGFKGKDPNGGKQHIYFHNARATNYGNGAYQSKKSIQQGNGTTNFNFYFLGEFIDNSHKIDLYSRKGDGKTASNYLSGFRSNNTRAQQGKYVEVFTNQQIVNNEKLVIQNPALKTERSNPALYDPNGIGAYKITSPDGKTYHYSQPVYHYEQVKRNLIKAPSGTIEKHISEKRQYSKYATHWLLTAVTGPDYVDNGNGIVDKNDLGYWVALDYGKWSDAYVWRSPYNGYDYNTNIAGEVDKEDFGHYQWGRKQLFYLDKIRNRTHTALFVKNLRKDGVGKDLEYKQIHQTVKFDADNKPPTNFNLKIEEDFTHPKEYQLRLDRVILLRNEHIPSDLASNGHSGLSPGDQGITYRTTNTTYQPGGAFAQYVNNGATSISNYMRHQAHNVIDVTDITATPSIKSNALKMIDFNYSYDLMKPKTATDSEVPTSIQREGKLTLESVQYLGRDEFEYMPPYQFTYAYNPAYPGEPSQKDPNQANFELKKHKTEWGFLIDENNPGKGETAWSLTNIRTPQGAEIAFQYKRDYFHTEAFSRRYWEGVNGGLQYHFYEYLNGEYNRYMEFRPNPNDSRLQDFDFTKYFKQGDKPFVDAVYDREPPFTGGHCAFAAGQFEVISVSPKLLRLDLPDATIHTDKRRKGNCNAFPWYYTKRYYEVHGWYSGDGASGKANNCYARSSGPKGGTLNKYKLIATRVPENQQGGGIRVTQIDVKDPTTGKTMKTTYDYRNPVTGEISGITSYAPVNGLKYVPYQTELPSAGVMYEWVTMHTWGDNHRKLSSTRYHYYTLQRVPDDDIFREDIEMNDVDGNIIFKASEETDDNFNTSKKIKYKKVKVEVNTAKIGQLKSIENFNAKGQLLNKIENTYLSSSNVPNRGTIKESFVTMKSIFNTDDDNNNHRLENRYLTISTREDQAAILKKVAKIDQSGRTQTEYLAADPKTGAFTQTKTMLPDGTTYHEEKVPAYTKYSSMGSKVDNVNNQHMLTQQAVETKYLGRIHSNNVLSQSISTWKDWNTQANGVGLWRKHKNYVWKGEINENGTYKNFQPFTAWTTGTPASGWQKVSEITRYNNYSVPIETVDINGHYAASRYDKNDEFVIASGNAAYNDFFATGFESNETVPNENQRTTQAHTGTKGYNLANGYTLSLGNKTVPYKISLWSTDENVKVDQKAAAEIVKAGDWYLLNFYKDTLSGTLSITGSAVIDDVRIHPVVSTINTYVYDVYGQLSYILNGNNMGTQFEYDPAGRLKTTFMEYPDKPDLQGGFKRASAHRYHYKNLQN